MYEQLRSGKLPEDIVRRLVRSGHDARWSEAFVERIDDRLQAELALERPRAGVPTTREGFDLVVVGFFIGFVFTWFGTICVFAFAKSSSVKRGCAWGCATSIVLLLSLVFSGST